MFKPKHLHAKFEEPKEVLSDANSRSKDIVKFMDEKQVGLVGQMAPAKEANFQKPLIAVYFEIDWKRNPKVLIYELPPDLICLCDGYMLLDYHVIYICYSDIALSICTDFS